MNGNARSDIVRFENKYMIDEATARAIAQRIRPVCRLDPFTPSGSDGYVIHSLYFDTPGLDFYWANVRGFNVRFKPRVRTYVCDPPCPFIWLELKLKIDSQTRKSRLRIDVDDWPYVLDASPLALAPEMSGCDAFLHVVRRYGAVPTMHVRYRREAYASEIDPYVRITFDRSITCTAAHGDPGLRAADPDFDHQALPIDDPVGMGAACSPALPIDDPVGMTAGCSPVLLEIKCERAVPHWLLGLIRGFQLERRGVSKYLLATHAQRQPMFRGLPWPTSSTVAARPKVKRSVPAALPVWSATGHGDRLSPFAE